MIKTLLWDCDGVLADSMRLHAEVEHAMFADYGFTGTPEDISARFGGMCDTDMLAEIEKETGKPFPADFRARLETRKMQVFSERLKPIDGVAEVLANGDLKHCVASSSTGDLIRHMLGVTRLAGYFGNAIVSADMVRKAKPAPDIFLCAAERMETEPAFCLVVEDSVHGVMAGKAAGMRVAGFIGGCHCGAGHGKLLETAGADFVFGHMTELRVQLADGLIPTA
ncbi:MAG: HAD family phosphatase [Alphaproteobacteria bacterium]|nr:HAD family phosphatase [Alphaproteobacteria bacterium]